MKNSGYYWAAISAFVIWGFFSIVLKPLEQYPSLDILFYRVFFCATIMLVISLLLRPAILKRHTAIFRRLPSKQKRKLILHVIGGGMLLTANWFFFIYVINHVSIKAGSFAYLVCPILTTVLACLLLKEKLTPGQWVAVGLSAASCIILGFSSLTDMLYSIVIGLSYALYLVSQPKNNTLDRFLLLTLQIACSALLLLPFYPAYRGPVPATASFYLLIIFIAILFTIVPLWLNLYALKGLKSSTIGILLYTNPLINFLMAILYYHETIDTAQAVAYSTVLASVILFNVKRKREIN